MKKNIAIIVLSSCSLCKQLISSLEYSGVHCNILDADSNEALCDKLEGMLGTNKYPMVIVGDKLGEQEYHYLTPLGHSVRTRTLPNGETCTGYSSLSSLTNSIIKL